MTVELGPAKAAFGDGWSASIGMQAKAAGRNEATLSDNRAICNLA